MNDNIKKKVYKKYSHTMIITQNEWQYKQESLPRILSRYDYNPVFWFPLLFLKYTTDIT